jgi:hypothetical protein
VLASRLVRPLRQRDFRLLFSAQAISWLGDRMVDVALAFAVLELGGSATDVGLVLAARTVPRLRDVEDARARLAEFVLVLTRCSTP